MLKKNNRRLINVQLMFMSVKFKSYTLAAANHIIGVLSEYDVSVRK